MARVSSEKAIQDKQLRIQVLHLDRPRSDDSQTGQLIIVIIIHAIKKIRLEQMNIQDKMSTRSGQYVNNKTQLKYKLVTTAELWVLL